MLVPLGLMNEFARLLWYGMGRGYRYDQVEVGNERVLNVLVGLGSSGMGLGKGRGERRNSTQPLNGVVLPFHHDHLPVI
jgi:hypothetical protein